MDPDKYDHFVQGDNGQFSNIVRAAIDEMCREEPHEAAIQRAVARALRIPDSGCASSSHSNRREGGEIDLPPVADAGAIQRHHAEAVASRKRLVGWTIAMVAAALLVVLLFVWRDRQSVAWAQVVKAVGQKPWLHATTTLPDGPDGKKVEGDLWFSANRAVMATRGGKEVLWADFEQKTREFYDSRENTIVRVPDDEVREGTGLYEAVFKAFLSADAEHTIAAGRSTLIHQQQRVVNEEGRHWIEHHFRLDDDKLGSMQEWVVYVKPDTHLPFRWEQSFQRADADHVDGSKTAVFRFDIDYPEMGPANIYALGVPKNAKVVDRLVDPARTDVKRLIAGIKDARWRSDKYYALIVAGADGEHWSRYSPEYRVWRNGARWKVERVAGFDAQPGKQTVQNVDPATWWRQKAEKLHFVPEEVCDGTWVWFPMERDRMLAIPPGIKEGDYIRLSYNHPEYLMRPVPNNDPFNPVSVNLKPNSGPPHTVLLEVHDSHWTPGSNVPQTWRYWIAPEQGHLVMRYEELVPGDGKEEIVRGHLIEGVTQDPGGKWYPSVVRLFNGTVGWGAGKPQDRIMRCYYDFGAVMPDNLFKVD